MPGRCVKGLGVKVDIVAATFLSTFSLLFFVGCRIGGTDLRRRVGNLTGSPALWPGLPLVALAGALAMVALAHGPWLNASGAQPTAFDVVAGGD